MNKPSAETILITVDVEDWFQVENFKPWISFDSWPDRQLRVEANVHRLLDLFDSAGKNVGQGPGSARICATFFILGWIARQRPGLVREIKERGHEVASHGNRHELCNNLSSEELRQDLLSSKKLLEDIIGAPVVGYRAPSFSISEPILKIIGECGYLYDSSYNSFAMHGRYGSLDLTGKTASGIAVAVNEDFFELPISNLTLNRHVIPLGGGGYFRLLPFWLYKAGVRRIIRHDGAMLFYMHPWEIDPGQPRVNEASTSFKFRHYVNLDQTEAKLAAMIGAFSHCRFLSCRQYLETIRKSNPADNSSAPH